MLDSLSFRVERPIGFQFSQNSHLLTFSYDNDVGVVFTILHGYMFSKSVHCRVCTTVKESGSSFHEKLARVKERRKMCTG